jgi:thioredoxin-like negative regulator of GroEL
VGVRTLTLPDLEPKLADAIPGKTAERPLLIFFASRTNGRCRRMEGFLAQVLQHRHNHETFALKFVEQEQRPDLMRRFGIDRTPTLLVVVHKVVRGRLVEPRGCAEIQTFLAPWLR